MSRIWEGKHNYLFYKYIQIHIVGGLYFVGNCTSCNQLTPSQALEHFKEYSYSCAQLCIVSKNLIIFTRKKWKER